MMNKNTLLSLFNSFEGKQLLIIGDVMIDSYLWGRVDRISPEAPVPIVALNKRESRLGGAANVALNVQNMGGVPILCSVIGEDEKSEVFFDLLQKQGLNHEGIIKSEERITTVKFRVIGNNAQMLRVDEEVEFNLQKKESQQLFKKIKTFVEAQKADAIIFEDYDKGVITPWLIREVTRLAHLHDLPVVVDPKKKNFWNYQNVNLFKPNLKELVEGLKLIEVPKTIEEIKQALHNLQWKLKAGIALVTLSDRGIYYSKHSNGKILEEGHIPAHVRDIADVSGAGDTVISLAALCMASGASAEITARLCNLGGGLVCEHVGVVPVDKEKLFAEASKSFCR